MQHASVYAMGDLHYPLDTPSARSGSAGTHLCSTHILRIRRLLKMRRGFLYNKAGERTCISLRFSGCTLMTCPSAMGRLPLATWLMGRSSVTSESVELMVVVDKMGRLQSPGLKLTVWRTVIHYVPTRARPLAWRPRVLGVGVVGRRHVFACVKLEVGQGYTGEGVS